MTPTELEAYDAMMKDRDHWKSLYFTMLELSCNATDIAERREQENARLRKVAQHCRLFISDRKGYHDSEAKERQSIIAELDDILSNTEVTCSSPESEAATKEKL
jgi:hypothetical protein